MAIDVTEARRVLKLLKPVEFPEVVSVQKWDGGPRWYINLAGVQSGYRGDSNLKLWMDVRGVIHVEQGPGIVSDGLRESRDTFLDACDAAGIAILDSRPISQQRRSR